MPSGAIASPTASVTSPGTPPQFAALETASPASPTSPAAAEQQASPQQQEQQLMLEDNQELTQEEREQEERNNYFATGAIPAAIAAANRARIYRECLRPNAGRNEDGSFSMRM